MWPCAGRLLTPGADPVQKVTIVPHGRALGVTEQRPDEDLRNYSRSYLLARLAVMLGGRAAEEVVVGQPTTGAETTSRAPPIWPAAWSACGG